MFKLKLNPCRKKSLRMCPKNLHIFCICSEWYPVSTYCPADDSAYSWYAKPFLLTMISTKFKTSLWVGKCINYSLIIFLEVTCTELATFQWEVIILLFTSCHWKSELSAGRLKVIGLMKTSLCKLCY